MSSSNRCGNWGLEIRECDLQPASRAVKPETKFFHESGLNDADVRALLTTPWHVETKTYTTQVPCRAPKLACLWSEPPQFLPAPNAGIRCPDDLCRGTPKCALGDKPCYEVPSAESLQQNKQLFPLQLYFSNVFAATSGHSETAINIQKGETPKVASPGWAFTARLACTRCLLLADPVAPRPPPAWPVLPRVRAESRNNWGAVRSLVQGSWSH